MNLSIYISSFLFPHWKEEIEIPLPFFFGKPNTILKYCYFNVQMLAFNIIAEKYTIWNWIFLITYYIRVTPFFHIYFLTTHFFLLYCYFLTIIKLTLQNQNLLQLYYFKLHSYFLICNELEFVFYHLLYIHIDCN